MRCPQTDEWAEQAEWAWVYALHYPTWQAWDDVRVACMMWTLALIQGE